MPFCPSCGSAVEGRFCAKCGVPVAADAPQGGAAPPPPPPASGAGIGDNGACALCYLFGFVTGIIFLVLAPYNQNKTVRFHAFQSIFMSLALIALSIVLSIFSVAVYAMSFALGSLFSLVHLVFSLGVFVLWLYMMWKAYQGQKVVLPVIGPLAEKQA